MQANVAPKQFLTITEPPRMLASVASGTAQFALKGGRGFRSDVEISTNLTMLSIGVGVGLAILTITTLSDRAFSTGDRTIKGRRLVWLFRSPVEKARSERVVI